MAFILLLNYSYCNLWRKSARIYLFSILMMKRFLYTIFAFASPLILLIGITTLFYTKTGGDLNRLGKISIDATYRNQFQKELDEPQNHTDFSAINLEEQNSFNILTIGDSFSQKRGHGYQNYLTTDITSIVNFDTRAYTIPSYNPIDLAFKITEGDIFNNLHIDYLIVQSVERYIVQRGESIEHTTKTTIETLEATRKTQSTNNPSSSNENYIDYLKFPFYNILYNFSDNALFSPVYQKTINKEVFSSNNSLLFFEEDITALEKNNNHKLVKSLNTELNILAYKLKERGISLIVLPSPDKYDLYYEYITTKNNQKPLFFDYMRDLKKEYLYIDSKNILKEHIDNGVKDIYFVDDTHWSPKGAKIIANSITETITKNR